MFDVKSFTNKCVDYAKNNRNVVLIGVAVVAVVITGILILANNTSFALPNILGTSDSKIAQKAIDYINNSGLSSTPVTLVKVGEASGLIKVTIKVGTNTFDSYVTKDGKLLFPQAYTMTATKTAPSAAANQNAAASTQKPAQTAASVTKTDKPVLEAFVVSSCPYGLQMQRAMADAVKSVPALASNIVVRYIGSISGGKVTSMHDSAPGGAEGQENLRQICIRDEQASKYWSYVSCYMQKASGTLPNGMPLGDSEGCLASTGVDTAKVNACMSDSKRGLAYAQTDFDENTKYSVQGSPTLILDGASIDETSFGGRSSDAMRAIICAASTSAPSFCSKTLNTASAAVSFSATYASATGGTAANTNCAPAQ